MFTKIPINHRWVELLRVGTGATLLACFVSLWPEYSRMYGTDGLVDVRLFGLQHQPFGALAMVPAGTWWLLPAYLFLCVFLIVGFATRVTAFLLLVLHHYLFTGLYAPFSYGVDYIASSCLLYCMVFSAGEGRSLFFLRILQVHVCMIYFFAGLGKTLGPTWRNGEALWKAVTQPGFDSIFKPDLLFLGAYPLWWSVGGWVVIILEFSYPLFIWMRPARRFWLWGMVGLHIGIALLMGLYSFSALMIVLNLSAFYVPYRSFAKQGTSNNFVSPLRSHAADSGPPVGDMVCTDTKSNRPYV